MKKSISPNDISDLELDIDRPHSRALRTGRISLPGKMYFTRKSIQDPSCSFLRNPKIAELLTDSFRWAKTNAYIFIRAFVVMPDHSHLLFRLGHAIDLESLFERMCKYVSRRANKMLNRTGRFWQYSFYDHMVRDNENLQAFVDYIHMNPVEAGLVKHPEEWEFSTANGRFAELADWE